MKWKCLFFLAMIIDLSANASGIEPAIEIGQEADSYLYSCLNVEVEEARKTCSELVGDRHWSCVYANLGNCKIDSSEYKGHLDKVVLEARNFCVKFTANEPGYNCIVHEDTYTSSIGSTRYYQHFGQFMRAIRARVIVTRTPKTAATK